MSAAEAAGPERWTPSPADRATVHATRARLGFGMAPLNAIVREALAEVGMVAPVDPDVLAHRLGLRVTDAHKPGAVEHDWFCGGVLIGHRIAVCEEWPDRSFSIAHEIGHWLMRRSGEERPGWHQCEEAARFNEDGADFIACALLDGHGLGEPATTLDAAELATWARLLDLEIAHAPGCPGAVFPGIGLLIDETIPEPERLESIAALLRRYGASAWAPPSAA